MPDAPAQQPVRRRQWGAEKSSRPRPRQHPRPSDLSLLLAGAAVVATILAGLAYFVLTVLRNRLDHGFGGFSYTMETILFVAVLSSLGFSSVMYLVARRGALRRFRDHERVPRAALERHFASGHQAVTTLVPSYAEEPDVIRLTLWSAALQEVPSLRVVLLLDDPPNPTDPVARERLTATRLLPSQIEAALSVPRTRFEAALFRRTAEFDQTVAVEPRDHVEMLEHYRWAVSWLTDMAEAEERPDHVSDFFVEQVLLSLADDLALTADAVEAAIAAGEPPGPHRTLDLYRRLVWIFSADMDVFERKKYASLSHESNKAMNLNAYLGLMGGAYDAENTPEGVMLYPASGPGPHTLSVPMTPYVLTLDADSILLPEYRLRLLHEMEQPGNERVAVIQTPYSAYRGAPTRLERLSGATTDLQHIQHQGFTAYDATFWVGANALIRRAALEDIQVSTVEQGRRVHRYIQDRTVIEDTESSIDIAMHGWRLVNYPERLSYSATPPDWGSLVVQRRRWANGGLLILPKLWRQAKIRKSSGLPMTFMELALRVNYMASITWATVGLLFLLLFPYDQRLLSPLVVLMGVPYFLAMASDLHTCGYKRTDVLRIYGFNLVLLSVNLSGVLKSLSQALSGQKIPFARTPKVRNRTAAPAWSIVMPILVALLWGFLLWREVEHQNWLTAFFLALNCVLTVYAIVTLIGVGPAVVDVLTALLHWFFVPRKAEPSDADAGEGLDWRSALYHGSSERRRPPRPRHAATEVEDETPTDPDRDGDRDTDRDEVHA